MFLPSSWFGLFRPQRRRRPDFLDPLELLHRDVEAVDLGQSNCPKDVALDLLTMILLEVVAGSGGAEHPRRLVPITNLGSEGLCTMTR